MRATALCVVLGMMGCATANPTPPQVKAKPPPPAQAAQKREVVVTGRGPLKALPGEISIAPKDQGVDFDINGGKRGLRCTKTESADPDEKMYCRDIQRGDSRNPDPGRLERSKTQKGWH